jgi:hypothetical protein
MTSSRRQARKICSHFGSLLTRYGGGIRLKAKGLSSQVVAFNITDGVLTLFAKTA